MPEELQQLTKADYAEIIYALEYTIENTSTKRKPTVAFDAVLAKLKSNEQAHHRNVWYCKRRS